MTLSRKTTSRKPASPEGSGTAPAVPRAPRTRFRDGRWWKQAPNKHWLLQCKHTDCARYLPQAEFTKDAEGVFSLWCLRCQGREHRRMERRLLQEALETGMARVCGQCRQPRPLSDFPTDSATTTPALVCTCCQQAGIINSRTDYVALAEAELFPDLVDYGGRVTGNMILSDPESYPGRTYFDLTAADRDRVILRAKELLFAATGLDLRKGTRAEIPHGGWRSHVEDDVEDGEDTGNMELDDGLAA